LGFPTLAASDNRMAVRSLLSPGERIVERTFEVGVAGRRTVKLKEREEG